MQLIPCFASGPSLFAETQEKKVKNKKGKKSKCRCRRRRFLLENWCYYVICALSEGARRWKMRSFNCWEKIENYLFTNFLNGCFKTSLLRRRTNGSDFFAKMCFQCVLCYPYMRFYVSKFYLFCGFYLLFSHFPLFAKSRPDAKQRINCMRPYTIMGTTCRNSWNTYL